MSFTCPSCHAPFAAGSEACAECGMRLVTAAPAAAHARPERPTGVTVVSALYFLFGGLAVLGAALAFVFFVILGGLAGAFFEGAGGGPAGFFAGMGALLAAFLALAGIVWGGFLLFTGWGLWSAKGWARLVAIVLSGFFAVSSLGTLVFGDPTAVVSLAVNGAIVWYLFQDDAKRWFQVA